MICAFRNFDQVKRQQDRLLSRLTDKEPDIAVQSMETKDNEISYDRIRTMFQTNKQKARANAHSGLTLYVEQTFAKNFRLGCFGRMFSPHALYSGLTILFIPNGSNIDMNGG